MQTSVTKIVKFETAHQLIDSYSKKNQTMHGHSYRCEITFEGDVNKETGMIIDFKMNKEILQPIVDKYDYQCFTKDSFGLNPTAENMCLDIFTTIRKNTTLIKRVRLWETDTCYAQVSY